MKASIDNAIYNIATKSKTIRISKQLSDILVMLDSEGNENEVKERIAQIVATETISEDLRREWDNLTHSIKIDASEKDKLIVAVKGIRTDRDSYSDDGFLKIRKLLKSSVPLTEAERQMLENAPIDGADLTDDYSANLKVIQDKYMNALLSD